MNRITSYNVCYTKLLRTDVPGFAAALAAAGSRVRGQRVLLVGAGGAARGVVHALLSGGAKEIVVANRTPARAAGLLKRFSRAKSRLRTVSLDALVDNESYNFV